MSITHITEFHAAPGQEGMLATLLTEGRNRKRAADGCELFDLTKVRTTGMPSPSSSAGFPPRLTTPRSPTALSRPGIFKRCSRHWASRSCSAPTSSYPETV
jgi:hypothetical protein